MASLKLITYSLPWLLLISYCEGTSRTESGFYCINQCKPTGNDEKPTCYYTYDTSEVCKPAGEILEYYTTKGEKCNGRCVKFGSSYDWCFDDRGSWNYCNPTPKLLSILSAAAPNSFTKNEFCRLKNDPFNYVQKSNVSRRRKRLVNNNTCNNSNPCAPRSGVRYLNEVQRLIDNIINDDDHFVTATYNNPSNPVTSVSTFDAPGDSNSDNRNHQFPVTLTVAMRAEIHYRHTLSDRDEIAPEVRSHLQLMDRERDDESGHLLADSLGGPGVPFNFAPQSPMLNRAVRGTAALVVPSCWWDVEALLRRYLRHNQNGFVMWNLLVEYRLYPASRRPTGFRLSVAFHDQNRGFVDYEGGVVHEYFFPNVPTVACSDLNHPWWSHWQVNQ